MDGEVKLTKEKLKELMGLSYFGGMLDSGGTIGFITVGSRKNEVPVVRMRRLHDNSFDWVKGMFGGSFIKRGDGFEYTVTYSKAIALLKVMRRYAPGRKADIDDVVKKYEEIQAKREEL